MKKVLLAIVLLALVVAVSYVRVQRRAERETKAEIVHQTETKRAVAEMTGKADSLLQLVENQTVDFQSALAGQDSLYRVELDSLGEVIDAERTKTGELEGKLASISQKKKKAVATKLSASKTKDTRHRQILDYYKKRFAELPGDLSSYEKDVARREIREESAQKFSITIRELNRIRKEHNLKY